MEKVPLFPLAEKKETVPGKMVLELSGMIKHLNYRLMI